LLQVGVGVNRPLLLSRNNNSDVLGLLQEKLYIPHEGLLSLLDLVNITKNDKHASILHILGEGLLEDMPGVFL